MANELKAPAWATVNQIVDQMEEIEVLKEKLRLTVDALEFYAGTANWLDREMLGYESGIVGDEEYFDNISLGGRRARQALKKLQAAQ
jgi:hypothetical protein